MTQPSLSFDHAADFYDATRAIPDHAIIALTDALEREIRAANAECVLEIGVGTGRIARPLAERGIRVCGIDIAPRMMRQLIAQLGPQHTPPDLLLADATQLPFPDDCFNAALGSHILHLIPAWEKAISELLRVLAPGGVFLATFEDDESSDWQPSADKWKELLDARNYVRPRVRADDESIAAALTVAGGTSHTETVATWDEVSTPAKEIEHQRNRTHSWNWEIPDDLYFSCFREFEEWALEYFGDLARPLRRRAAQHLQVWRFPTAAS